MIINLKIQKYLVFFEGKENLTKFYIGRNLFEINHEKKNNIINNNIQNENLIINDKTKKYKMHYIKEIELGKGAFNDSTIKIISLISFSNLIIIELSGNGLHSLNFVEDLECENLE